MVATHMHASEVDDIAFALELMKKSLFKLYIIHVELHHFSKELVSNSDHFIVVSGL